MIYRTTKCPYCGFALERMSPYAKELIGPPLAKCPECMRPIQTGMNYWPQMPAGAKAWFLTRSLLLMPWTVVLLTAMTLVVPLLVLGVVVDDVEGLMGENPHVVTWVAGAVAIGWTVVFIRSIVARVRMRPEEDASIPEWR